MATRRMISTNIPKVKKAFKEQEDQLKILENLEKNNAITVEDNTTGTIKKYDFTKYKGADDLEVQDVFKMFQNWSVMNTEDGGYKQYSAAEVQVRIAGKLYQFEIKRDKWGQEKVTDESYAHHTAMKYQALFDAVLALKGDDTFTIQKMAKFMLKASTVGVNDARTYEDYWKKEFPFLKKKVNVRGMANGVTMWELLCDIMAIAQVAEAARPDPEFFEKWMTAAEAISEKVATSNNPFKTYFQQLEAEHGINRNSDFSGRVPYADTVFRKMLQKIEDGTLTNEELQAKFENDFPMCKSIEHPPKLIPGCAHFTASAVNLGRYYILYVSL